MDIPVRILLQMINLGALSGLASSLTAASAAQGALAVGTKNVTIGMVAMGLAVGVAAAAFVVFAAAVLTAAVSIATSLAGLIYDSIKVAMSFETAFANVRKAVEATPAELAIVRQGLLDLSLTIPVTPNQLAAIAALGAQLGVTKENLVDFTRTIAVLGSAVDNMRMEDAANYVAKFAAVMGNTKNWDLIANVLVDLGNKGNSTEDKIMRMATRIGGSAHVMELSIPATLAFSAALANVGVEAERGGTQAQRVILALGEAAKTGSTNLQALANIAGIVPKQFQEMIRTNPDSALRALAIGMTTTKERGIDLVAQLADIGIKGYRATTTFLQLAGSGDLVRKAFDDATLAAKNNNAAYVEAAKKWETLANQLILVDNAITVIQTNIGTAFIPAITASAEMLRAFLVQVALLTKGMGPGGLTSALVHVAQTITGMLLIAFAYILDFLGKQVREMTSYIFFWDKVKIAVVLFGEKVYEIMAKVALAFGNVVLASKNMGIADSLHKEAERMGAEAIRTKTGLDLISSGMISVGVMALRAASGAKGLTAGMVDSGMAAKLLGGDLGETTKRTGALTTGTAALTKEQERAAEAARKLAASIGTKGLAEEMRKMEAAITSILAGGGKLTQEGIEKVAKLAAEGFLAGLTIPPQMQDVAAQKLADDAQKALDKAKKILAGRIAKQGGLFTFEELRSAAIFARSAETGEGAVSFGNGLWSVDPETKRGFEDMSEMARRKEEEEIERLSEIAERWATISETLGAMDELWDAFGISGESALRQITNGYAEVAGGAAKFYEGMASGDPAKMIAGVAGAIKGIKGMVTSGSGATRAAGGALAGFLVAGIPGAIVGAIVFGLREPSWKRVAKEAGRVLGEDISEDMAKEIEKRSKDMRITITASALLSLPDLMESSERGPLEFLPQISALMRGIVDGSIPAKEGMLALADATAMVFEALEKMGAAGSAMIGDLLAAAAAGDVMTEQMKELAKAAGGQFADGMKKMFDAVNNGLEMSAENVGKLGELTAFAYVRLRDLGFSMVEAMTMLGPAIDAAIKAIEESGAVVGPMLASMIDFRQRVLDNEDLINFAEGLNQAGEAALRLGLALDPAAAQNFGDLTTQAFNDLILAGFTAEQAVSILGSSMNTLNELSRRGVIVLTEEQQAMLDLAASQGLLDPTPQEAMVEATKQLVVLMGLLVQSMGIALPAAIQAAIDKWNELNSTAGQTPTPGGPNGGPNGGPDEGPGGHQGDDYAIGGLVIAPSSGRQVTVHGREAITPLEQVYGKMADIVASKLTSAAGGDGGTILINAPIYIAGRKVDEVMIERTRAGLITIHQESIVGG